MFASIFEPDSVMPSQYLARESLATKSRECRLLLAILEEAITHYLSRGRTQEHKATLNWIHSSASHFLTYRWLCGLFGFDPHALRRELIRRRRRGERAGFRPRLTAKKRGKVGGK